MRRCGRCCGLNLRERALVMMLLATLPLAPAMRIVLEDGKSRSLVWVVRDIMMEDGRWQLRFGDLVVGSKMDDLKVNWC